MIALNWFCLLAVLLTLIEASASAEASPPTLIQTKLSTLSATDLHTEKVSENDNLEKVVAGSSIYFHSR